jgi:tRNA U38,U39,U40 pseudouridine synthase TruA
MHTDHNKLIMPLNRDRMQRSDRTLGGVTSPPEGLYFEQVEYPAEYDLPAASLSGFPIQP